MATIKSIEEKAKRFDEALEKARRYYDEYKTRDNILYVEDMEDMFPELKESEDEKIRKEIISALKFANHKGVYDKHLAWLEKQGEHAKFCDSIQVGDKVTRNEDGVLVNLSQLNRVAKKDEKQGGQKPTDKVEPMFREGDWVVYCNDDVDLITGIEENGYCINNGGYIPFVCASDIRLWTIQDAKDGDVISWDDSKCIAIFKNIYDEDSFNSYGFVGGCTGTFESRMSYHDIEGAHPATKEQRDTLIKAMADAGYAFDFEKKELKKIEQKPVWSQDVQEEPVSEDLGDYINELSKQFPEVSFAKLSRIAVRAAKWQIEQINEVLLSEVLPCFMHGGEADEVLAKLEEVLNKK